MYIAFVSGCLLFPGAGSHTSNIVSSIEFDRDSEYFATAGVTKEIKVYEYVSSTISTLFNEIG